MIIKLPIIPDERGNLTFLESQSHIPFDIKRVYWIYDVPGGERRGGHAFKRQNEFIIALSGSFEVLVHNGVTETRTCLNRSYMGLYIPGMTWRSLENFSTNSLALIVSDLDYNPEDYIRSFDHFLKLKNG